MSAPPAASAPSTRHAGCVLALALVLAGAGAARAESDGAHLPDLAALAAEVDAGQAGAGPAPEAAAPQDDVTPPGDIPAGADPNPPAVTPEAETEGSGSGDAPAPPEHAPDPAMEAGSTGLTLPADAAAAWDFPATAQDLADRAAASLARISQIEGAGPAATGSVCDLLSELAAPGTEGEHAMPCPPAGSGG